MDGDYIFYYYSYYCRQFAYYLVGNAAKRLPWRWPGRPLESWFILPN